MGEFKGFDMESYHHWVIFFKQLFFLCKAIPLLVLRAQLTGLGHPHQHFNLLRFNRHLLFVHQVHRTGFCDENLVF